MIILIAVALLIWFKTLETWPLDSLEKVLVIAIIGAVLVLLYYRVERSMNA